MMLDMLNKITGRPILAMRVTITNQYGRANIFNTGGNAMQIAQTNKHARITGPTRKQTDLKRLKILKLILL